MTPPSNRGRKFPAEPLTSEEVRALLGAASARSPSGVRMRALIAVLYGSGLRISEALSLMPRDVDLDRGLIRVRHGKGNRSRTIGVDPFAAGLLALWLQRRAQLGLRGHHPIFGVYEINRVGRPLSPRYVRSALQRLAVRAQIDKRVHPHGLRHSLAFDLAQRSVPVHQIQAQLGHSTLAVTDRYVRHLLPGDVISMMQAHDWGENVDH